ncbi:MAG: carboxypeptidase-like regulatory domain-containing protein, partial [Gemmatimonadetes bacterium]|nr:carboxypeptidase-like regulatory domain-containing protein [Gemmatimonadota bacterium]
MPAQTQSAPSLAGRVSDTNGRPLPQAQVTLTRIGRNVLTDATGRFVFRNVPVGIHRVQATFMGYAPASQEVSVGAAESTQVDFTLQSTPLSLEEIQVTGTPTAADARAVTQATTQLSGKALERNLGGTVAQTLALQPGIRVRYNGPAAAVPIMRG